jgi:hypothetical protein
MAGYSGTPLVKKLGIGEGFKIFLINAPPDYRTWVSPLPAEVSFITAATLWATVAADNSCSLNGLVGRPDRPADFQGRAASDQMRSDSRRRESRAQGESLHRPKRVGCR